MPRRCVVLLYVQKFSGVVSERVVWLRKIFCFLGKKPKKIRSKKIKGTHTRSKGQDFKKQKVGDNAKEQAQFGYKGAKREEEGGGLVWSFFINPIVASGISLGSLIRPGTNPSAVPFR